MSTAMASVQLNGTSTGTPVAAAPFLTDAMKLINSIKTFIFDCDGVIWKGDKLIDGVPETLDMLHAMGKRLVFVTNNSTKSRKQYAKKFDSFGLNVAEVIAVWRVVVVLVEDLVYNIIYMVSFSGCVLTLTLWNLYLLCSAGRDICILLCSSCLLEISKLPSKQEGGIQLELTQAGISHIGGPEDGDKKIELAPGQIMDHDHHVGAVVVGFDRFFNYYKLQYATLCLRENPGCLFIATNCDAITYLTYAQEWAGAGAMVGALKATTNKEPVVVGKPSTFLMDYLASEFQISTSEICMVGDRLDTDILFGQNGSCRTLLVLSGVTSLDALQSPENSIQPDAYINQLSDLLSAKKSASA